MSLANITTPLIFDLITPAFCLMLNNLDCLF